MALDYEKFDNWEKEKATFAKIIGNTDYEKVSKKLKLFDKIDSIIKEMDAAIVKALKGQKKDGLIPEDADKVILSNNDLMPIEINKLGKALDDNLDDKYDDAIENLTGELSLYRSIYMGLKKNSKSKDDDLQKLRKLAKGNNFLEPGSFDTTFKKGETALQEVAKELRSFSENKGTKTAEDIIKLYAVYNKKLPGYSNGVRSITTYLQYFLDYEVYFERHKVGAIGFKLTKPHSEIKDYETFCQYTKAATIFIKKLTPWANGKEMLSDDYINEKVQEGADVVIKDIGSRLVEAKRIIIQARTYFVKLF